MDIKKTLGIKADKYLIPDAKIDMAETLYVGHGRNEVRERLRKGLKKQLLMAGALALIVMMACLMKSRDAGGRLVFSREELNGGSKAVSLILSINGEEMPFTLELGSRELSEEETDALHECTERFLDEKVAGRNQDFDSVSEKLVFPAEIRVNNKTLYLSWSSDRADVIDRDGNVGRVAEETYVTVVGKVRYGREFRTYERVITVVPKVCTEAEQRVQKAIQELLLLESDRENDTVILPEEIDGVKIAEKGDGANYTAMGIMFAVLILVVGYYSYFARISDRKKQRVREGTEDYKDFIRKFTLLLASGMSVRLAWKKLSKDYESAAPKSLLAEALLVSVRELDSGIRESICYSRFGERMCSAQYERLAEIISQQATKGVAHICQVLEAELREVCENEKEQIKVKAEKAGTALLLPMMGLLSMVFLVIMIPAFSGMN